MKLCRLIMVVSIGFLMIGCSAVYVPEPVGEEAVELDETWSGAWLHEEHVIQARIGHAENGLLNVVWVEQEKGKLVLKSYSVNLRTQGEHTFASFWDDDSDHGYIWMLLDRPSEDVVVIWMADANKFRSLISDGKLKGEVLHPDNEHNDNVVLEDMPSELLEQITEPSSDLLVWEEPIVLTRISK